MKISDTKVQHQNRAADLRSQAQELKDAAGGEKASAISAKKDAGVHGDVYVHAKKAEGAFLNEAKQLRAEAAEKLKAAVGGRGLHALENVARGFASLMSKLSGQRLSTTVSLKEDPQAKAAAEQLTKLAESKEKAAADQHAIALNAHAQATAALAKMEGHEQTAAAHMELAGKLLGEARGHDAKATFAAAAEKAGATVKGFFDDVKKDLGEIGKDLEKEVRAGAQEIWTGFKSDLRDLLHAGADALLQAAKNLAEKPIAEAKSHAAANAAPSAADVKKDVDTKATNVEKKKEIFYVDSAGTVTIGALPKEPKSVEKAPVEKAPVKAPEKPVAKPVDAGFTPGQVSFGGAPRGAPVITAPNIEAPPKGEKKASESLVAARWAAEAAGIDWTAFTSTGDLKKAVAEAHSGLGTKNGSSPFEVKKRIAERLGMSTKTEAVHAMDLTAVRAQFMKREAVGLPRTTPRAEFEASITQAGMPKDASLEELAMFGTSKASFALQDAAVALKRSPDGAAEKAAFAKASATLDNAKRVMLDVVKGSAPADRRILMLDTVDAMEVGHGKPAATTKLGFAVGTMTSGGIGSTLQKALGLDDGAFAKATQAALKASEWTTLGEMTAPSGVLGFPGALSGEQRAMIGKLPDAGARLAQELGLLDKDGLAALKDHLRFTGNEGPGAQILGATRMLSALASRRDFRTKDLLKDDEIREELLKNARGPEPKLDPKLLSLLQPVLGDAIAALRQPSP